MAPIRRNTQTAAGPVVPVPDGLRDSWRSIPGTSEGRPRLPTANVAHVASEPVTPGPANQPPGREAMSELIIEIDVPCRELCPQPAALRADNSRFGSAFDAAATSRSWPAAARVSRRLMRIALATPCVTLRPGPRLRRPAWDPPAGVAAPGGAGLRPGCAAGGCDDVTALAGNGAGCHFAESTRQA